jgi:hypothetical protein
MKKSELVSIIREVVRKEIKTNVKKQVNMAVRKQLTEIFIDKGKDSFVEDNSLLDENVTRPKPNPKRKLENYVEDPVLNQILNETNGGVPSDEYETLGGGVFDRSRMAELTGLTGQVGTDDETKRNIAAAHTLKSMGTTSEEVPEALSNALTRDYSALVKKFKK